MHRRALLGVALTAPAIARAQPRGTARIVVGFPAGGSADLIARLVAERLRGRHAPNVIVENRPGAAGRIAIEHVKAADPDGSTLLLTPSSMLTIFPHLYPRTLRYDPFTDLVPVSPAGEFAFGLAAGPQAGMPTDLAAFVAWAKPRRDVPFSAAAAGARPHFMGVQFARAAGLSMSFIPYRGSAESVPALLAGDIAATWNPLVDLIGQHQGGRARILAVSTPARTPRLPEVPTFAELGFPDLTSSEWFGILLPGGAPAALATTLAEQVATIAAEPEYRAALDRVVMTTAPLTPTAFAARIRAEHAQWGPIIAASGFRPEDG